LSANARFHSATQNSSKINQVAAKEKQLKANLKERKNQIIVADFSRISMVLILAIKIVKTHLIL